jgi:hypothetical protein
LKTNNYLRAIDRRLGNPNNTFNVINNISWDVYKKEICSSRWLLMREHIRFYFVRIGLFALYFSLRVRMLLGLYVDEEAL